MKIWMSRARFEDMCRGLSPIEREKLASAVELYPDDLWDAPVWQIDQDRIGADYERLFAEQQARASAATAWYWAGWLWSWPKRSGKATFGRSLPPEWKPLGPGVWIAPADIPPPVAPPCTIVDDDWLELDDPPRRYLLNDVVAAGPLPADPGVLDTIRQLMGIYGRLRPGIVRQIRAGRPALDALAAVYPPPEKRPAAPLSGATQMGGIPMVEDPDLAPNAWQLVDPATGQVLFSGVIGPSLDDYIEAVRGCIDDLADRTGLPPKFFM